MDDCSPQRQQNTLVVSQPSSLLSIVSDTHTTTSPVTTLSVVECLTTSSGVVTSISGQYISTITTTAGKYNRIYICMYTCMYNYIYRYTNIDNKCTLVCNLFILSLSRATSTAL